MEGYRSEMEGWLSAFQCFTGATYINSALWPEDGSSRHHASGREAFFFLLFFSFFFYIPPGGSIAFLFLRDNKLAKRRCCLGLILALFSSFPKTRYTSVLVIGIGLPVKIRSALQVCVLL